MHKAQTKLILGLENLQIWSGECGKVLEFQNQISVATLQKHGL